MLIPLLLNSSGSGSSGGFTPVSKETLRSDHTTSDGWLSVNEPDDRCTFGRHAFADQSSPLASEEGLPKRGVSVCQGARQMLRSPRCCVKHSTSRVLWRTWQEQGRVHHEDCHSERAATIVARHGDA